MNCRSNDFLRLTYNFPCQLQVQGVCEGGSSGEPAHSNQQRHGKSGGIKAHDAFVAPACRACHNWLDFGPADRETKQAAFQTAMERFWLLALESGRLVVKDAPEPRQAPVERPLLGMVLPRPSLEGARTRLLRSLAKDRAACIHLIPQVVG